MGVDRLTKISDQDLNRLKLLGWDNSKDRNLDKEHLFVFRIENIVVGYILSSDSRSSNPHIYELYVLERYWGNREYDIGLSLLAMVLDKYREDGCEEVSLGVENDNYRAIRFYEKHGFVLVQNYKESRMKAMMLKI